MQSQRLRHMWSSAAVVLVLVALTAPMAAGDGFSPREKTAGVVEAEGDKCESDPDSPVRNTILYAGCATESVVDWACGMAGFC